MLELGIKITAAFLVGSVLGSLVVGRLFGGVDIRKVGSGNPGGTNALRTQGKLFAFLVILIDVGKGIVAVLVLPNLDIPGIGIDASVDRDLLIYGVAFAVIVGHVYPIWFEFKGGKGGATAAGILFVLAPATAAIVVGIWIAIVAFSGFVGLATMGATVAAALIFAFQRLPAEHDLVLFTVCVAVLIIYSHRGNIVRMWNGTESRIGRRFRRD